MVLLTISILIYVLLLNILSVIIHFYSNVIIERHLTQFHNSTNVKSVWFTTIPRKDIDISILYDWDKQCKGLINKDYFSCYDNHYTDYFSINNSLYNEKQILREMIPDGEIISEEICNGFWFYFTKHQHHIKMNTCSNRTYSHCQSYYLFNFQPSKNICSTWRREYCMHYN